MTVVRRCRLRFVLAALAATSALPVLFAGQAAGATELGTTFNPGTSFCGNFLFQSVSPPTDTYAATANGVITSWSYEASSGPVQLKLKIGRFAGGNNWTVVDESAVETATAAKLNTFKTRISVLANDVIGMTPVTNGLPCVRGMAPGYSYSAYVMGNDVPPGTTATFNPPNPDVQLDLAASLEADKDKDGFGDETQDQCLGFAGKSDGCPPNKVSFGKLKRNKEKGTAMLAVVLPGPGTLTLAGKGLVKQRPAGHSTARPARALSDGGKAILKIRPKGAKKRKLQRTGKVKVKAAVTYTPTGGKANTETRRIKLLKRLGS